MMVAVIALVVLPNTSCAGDRAASDGTLILSAAADLAAALPALTAAFTDETGITVAPTIGASGMLAQQIMNGAPVDVFASADRSWVDRLEAAGRTVAGTRATYAQGSLALVVPARADRAPLSLEALRDESYARIAIANPDVAPYGRAARQALQNSGVWDVAQSRMIIGENVRQALEYVAGGNVDAAVVARALVPEDAKWTPVPRELHEALLQDIVVVNGTAHEDAARRFVEFVTRGNGRGILRRHHFTLPDSATP
jgi:molybdate transport system substrate-binding protein